MKYLKRWILAVFLVFSLGVCTSNITLDRTQHNVRICVTNGSTDAYRLYLSSRFLGSVYQTESRWVYVPKQDFIGGNPVIRLHNTTGTRDGQSSPLRLLPGVDYRWLLTDNVTVNEGSITPTTYGTQCK